jgi:hypothetical protein
MSNHQWRPLTTELGDTKSPLRQYMMSEFPNGLALRKQFRARSGPLIVEGNGTAPMTLGTAFDVMARMLIVPGHYPVDFIRSRWWQEAHDNAGIELVQIVRQALEEGGPAKERLYRSIWALGLLTEISRSMQAWMEGPVNPIVLAEGATLAGTVAALLTLAPEEALIQLDELRKLAETNLIPKLGDEDEVIFDPLLTGSVLIPASADIVADGLLIDMKVQLGTANAKTGVRTDDMTAQTVNQLVSYVLLDLDDFHKIKTLGIYSARYGSLITWPVQEALDLLAGKRVDLKRMREEFPDLLRNGFTSR